MEQYHYNLCLLCILDLQFFITRVLSILTVYYAITVEITNYYAITVEIAVITRLLSKSRFIYQEETKMYYKDNQNVLKDCLGKLKGEERSTCTMHERKLRHVLQELEAGRESKERVKSECVPVINYLLQSKNKVINQEIELIRQGLEEILRGKNDFIDQFFEVERFHSSMIQKLQVLMKTFMKTRGYEPNRLVYMILSYVKNMKKIEPYSCYEITMYLAEERRSYGKIKTSNAAISKLIKYVYKLDSIIEKKVK